MSRNSTGRSCTRTWRSLIATLAATAVLATPALVTGTAAPASAGAPERTLERAGTQVSASASPTRINPGESTTVSGVVTYEGAPYVGATVDLLARNAKRPGRFRVVATGTTDPLGEVAFTRSPLRATVFRLLVRHTEGSPPRAVSDKVRVFVRTASSLSIRGRTTAQGYAVSGVLRGGGGPMPGRLVALELLGEDGETWTAIDSARTSRRGKVRFLEPSSEGASYRLSFAGGHRFAPSVSGVVVN